ncbi:EF-hand domain-containing protein [Vibrio crassostreae]|uniref:hypothetical protein n=1 Tax=Vibrio crassostreae TaxID=246167 RepID=UPI00148B629F|nr:hypothetical protein [Vibrio crassostreae]NOH74398.1 hypothetical protein [Vibrio crassostreae]CAK2471534.1 EF-hand domain-containing protein [Vibrio crassostreae]CAK2853897.1 EF-hand domain-containing protein [Vibrio crassostreae]CAK3448178.1 EF-hand domain-containing protein [Vibrio crassostreae]
MFEDELSEARTNYTEACNHHAQMAELHRDGEISDEELMEAIEDMRQAQNDLEEARSNYC